MIYFTIHEFLSKLKEEGLPHSFKGFIFKYEETGQLKCRRDKLTNYRIFTDQDIKEIVAAIKKDGRDFKWHAKKI